jgi:hypothetical protein
MEPTVQDARKKRKSATWNAKATLTRRTERNVVKAKTIHPKSSRATSLKVVKERKFFPLCKDIKVFLFLYRQRVRVRLVHVPFSRHNTLLNIVVLGYACDLCRGYGLWAIVGQV